VLLRACLVRFILLSASRLSAKWVVSISTRVSGIIWPSSCSKFTFSKLAWSESSRRSAAAG
jgi:hypothetical protein